MQIHLIIIIVATRIIVVVTHEITDFDCINSNLFWFIWCCFCILLEISDSFLPLVGSKTKRRVALVLINSTTHTVAVKETDSGSRHSKRLKQMQFFPWWMAKSHKRERHICFAVMCLQKVVSFIMSLEHRVLYQQTVGRWSRFSQQPRGQSTLTRHTQSPPVSEEFTYLPR